MWKVIVLCAILGLTAAQKATFENYKVFRVTPITEEQLEILRQLENVHNEVSRIFNRKYRFRKSRNVFVELLAIFKRN